MTKKKNVRKALIISLSVTLICLCVLVGSTFAWFTDSASSARNKIITGTLDVALNYWDADAGDYVDASNAALFDDEALWEPGHAEVAYLEIENNGSLAFNYLFAVYPTEETAGFLKSGRTFYVSDYLVYSIIKYDVEESGVIATREDALRLAENHKMGLTEGNYTYDSMVPGQESVRLALIVYMPTYVTSEQANHDLTRGPAPHVRLAVDVYATQYTYESDSFNNQYDSGLKPDWPKPIWRFTPDGYVIDETNKTITINTIDALKYLGTIYDDMVHHPYYEPSEWEIILGADLDFGGEILTEPIQFGGFKAFNGNNKTITNVILNYIYLDEEMASVGLFDVLPSTKDLTLTNVYVTAENAAAGILAGSLVGDSYSGITIADSSASGYGFIGGLIGWGNFLHPIDFSGIQFLRTDLFSGGFGSASAGSIAGYYGGGSSANVSNVTVSGFDASGVTGAGSYVGGLFGELDAELTVTESTITEITIYKDVYVGSITGKIYNEQTVRVTSSTVAVQASTGSGYKVINLTTEGTVEDEDVSVDALGFPQSALHTSYDGHFYQVIQQRVNWNTAYQNCINMYGHLATVGSAAENAALARIVTNHGGSTWLGACRESWIVEGGDFYKWVWITGEEWTYSNWDGGEPNNYQNLPETCMHMYASSGLWNDYNYANTSATAYVCEWDSLQSYLNYLTATNN